MLYENIMKDAAAKYAASKSDDAKVRKAVAEAFMEGAKANERCRSVNKKKVPEKFDRRVKITAKQRAELVKLREQMGYTYQRLADMFGISNGYAQALCKPELMALRKLMSKQCHRQKPQDYSVVKDSIRYRRSLAAQGLM